MIVAESGNKTIACIGCGGWDAPWTSRFSGHEGAEHIGDLSQYCRDCKKVYDVFLSDSNNVMGKVRMHPDDVDWQERRVLFHAGASDWWEKCPGDVMVHVGHEETSRWLARVDGSGRDTLHTVRVVGAMPKRLGKDQVDKWGRYSLAYINEFETPGRVSLYLPKSRLELVDRVSL